MTRRWSTYRARLREAKERRHKEIAEAEREKYEAQRRWPPAKRH